MVITFFTVLAALYTLAYGGWIGLIFYAFLDLTPRQQEHAKITIGAGGLVLFIVSIAFLITRIIA